MHTTLFPARIALFSVLAFCSVVAQAQQAPTFGFGPSFGTFTIGEIQDPLPATGGNGTYSWAVTSGSLPPGIALRTDTPSSFAANAQAGLIGIATMAGTYNFTLSVTSNGQTVQQACTMKITAETLKDGFTLPPGFVSQAYSYTFTPLNTAGPVTWNVTSPLPPGVTFVNGVVAGTPTQAGTWTVNFNFSDGTDTVFRSFSLTVNAIRFTTLGALTNATQNSTYGASIAAAGGSGSFTYTTTGGLPNGLTLTASGAISGTANTGPGKYGFAVTATDTNSVSFTKNFSITVIGVPPALPVINGGNYQYKSATIGFNFSRVVSVASGGSGPFTWTATGMPPGISVRGYDVSSRTDMTPGDAEIWGTPTATGTFNVQLTVTDANGASVTEDYLFVVSALGVDGNDSPPNGTLGVAYSKRLRVLGGAAPYSVAQFDVVNRPMPAGLAVNNGSFTLQGTPTETGSFSPVIRFTDSASNVVDLLPGINITSASSTININQSLNLGATTLDLGYSRQLTACCSATGLYAWSQVSGNLPPGIGLSAAGLLSGTPTVVGTYVFIAQAADPTNLSNLGLRQFQLIVTPMNLSSSTSLPFGNVGSFYNQGITVTGATGALSFALEFGNFMPPGLSLNPTTGAITGTPSATGQYSFTIDIGDTLGHLLPRTFNVSIFSVGALPPLAITSPGTNLGTWGVGPRETGLVATGASGAYSWSLTAGSLPPGMLLRPDRTSFISTSASAVLAGVLTTPGTYNFTLTVSSAGQNVSQAFTVTVSGLVLMEYYNPPDAHVSVAYTHTFTALNNAGPVAWTATNIPPGLLLSSGGILSGTPTTAGSYALNLTMNDGVSIVTTPLQITLNVFALQITSAAILSATQYQPYSTTVTASGGAGGYSFTANSLPAGLTLDPNTGILSGTPTGGAGRFSFSLTVTDSAHTSYTRSQSIVIVGSPKRLMWLAQYGNLDDCSVYSYCSEGIAPVDGGTPPFSYTASGLPPGMGIRSGFGNASSYVTPGDAELWGTPTSTGTYPITITVTDADGTTSTQTFPLHISQMYRWGGDSLQSGTRGVPYSDTMRIIGGTGGYTVQKIGGFYPDGLSQSGFTVSGTPLENGGFSPQFIFSDSAGHTYQVTEGFSIGDGSSTVTINQGSSLGVISVGSSYSNQLTACCVPSLTWALISGSLPPGLTLSANGLLSGSPTTAGTYIFLVQTADATNLSNTGLRQFQLIVTPIVVTTSGTLPTGNVGTFYTQTLAATGTTGAVTWTLAPLSFLPPGLTLDSAAGIVSGTPAQQGYYFFTINTTDAGGNFFSRQFNIAIYPAGVNPPLALNFGPFITSIVGQLNFQLPVSGGVPPYHYAYSPGAMPVPGMSVQDGPPLPTSFPTTVTGGWLGIVTNPGIYVTSLRVTDSIGTIFDRPVALTVVNLTVLSQNSPPKAVSGTPYSFTFTAYGGSGNYSWLTTSAMPPGLTLSANGTLSGTPSTAGNFGITVTLTDLTNGTAVGLGYTIAVNAFAITNSGVLPQGAIGAAYSQTLQAPNCGTACVWSLASGALPSGLTLSSSGALAGSPTGFYNSGFLAQASGSNGTVQKEFGLLINFNTIQPLFINQGAAIGPSSQGGLTSFFLAAQGGTPPYTWSQSGGALPPGITLQSPGETIGANFVPGGWYLAGKPMIPGSYTFTMKVTDAASKTSTMTYTWSVPQILISYTSLPVAAAALVYNQPYIQRELAIGGSGSYTWAPLAAMPPGLSISAAGLVTGTPANTGSYTVSMQVTDTLGNIDVQNVSFNITSPSGVTISLAGPNLGTFGEGVSSVVNLNPTGGTGPYTITALTALPGGCAIESGSTLLSNTTLAYVLTCSPMAAGNYTFTLQVTDSLGNIGVRTETLHIAPFNLFTTTSLNAGAVGRPYSVTLLAWDNAGAVTWSIAPGNALPNGLNLIGNTITGTPAIGSAGLYSFTLDATDASGQVIGYTFALTISTIGLTDADTLPQAIFGTLYSYTFTAVGGGNKTFTATGLPAGLTMSAAGTLSGTPTSTGTFRVVVTVTDGASTYTHPFTLFARFNDAGVPTSAINALLGEVRVGQSFSVGLSLTGGVPPFVWTVAAGSALPPGMNLYSGALLAPNQTTGLTYLQGAPTVAGAYSFDLIATDSTGTQMRRTFMLNVRPIAILAGNLKTAITGTPYSEQLTVVGGTPPYMFTYAQNGLTTDMLPPGFTASASGLISGVTTSTGAFGFTASALDQTGATFTATYSLPVTNPSGLEITTSMPLGVRWGRATSTTISTNGVSTYNWSIVAGALPPGMTITPTGATTLFSGPPTAFGNFSFTLRATDTANNANFADRAYTLPVQPMQTDLPLSGSPRQLPVARLGVPYSYNFTITGGTPPYRFAAVPLAPLPPGMTLSQVGVLSGTPAATGNFAFDYAVTDANNSTGLLGAPNLVVLPAGALNPVQGRTFTFDDASVGVAYAGQLDGAIIGGVPPFTWAAATGSNLPPGMTILPGGNGVSSYIGGIPTTAGPYSFTLQATDAAGQTGLIVGTMNVSLVSASPHWFPTGMVGTAYSATLTPAGGTGPYTLALSSGTSLPPGLSFNGNTLAGIPTSAGEFTVQIVATDSLGNSVTNVRPVIIDNAAGQSKGLALSPDYLQLSYVLTSPAPAAIPLNLNITTSPLPFTAIVTGIPGATISPASGNTSTGLSLTLNPAALSAGTFAGVITAAGPPGYWFAQTPVVLTVTAPPPCTYVLTPTGGSIAAGGGPGSFSVATGTLCTWTPVASDSTWIAINSGAGPGPGTVNFTLSPNLTPATRTGSITLGGQAFSITQFGGVSCSFGVNPTAIAAAAAGGIASVGVTASAGTCSWGASGAIVSLPAACTGGQCLGNNAATLTIPANATANTVQYNATVAGQLVTVTQTGVNCVAALTPSSIGAGAAGSTGSFQVSMPVGCSYSAISGPAWMRITANGSGGGPYPATVTYTVDPNSTTLQRSGSFSISGAGFQITQDPTPCGFTMDSSALPGTFAVGGDSGRIGIQANGNNCTWTASSPVPWATVTPTSGTGNGVVNVTVSSNAASTVARPAALTIANQPVSITQAGTACSYSLASPNGNVPFAGGAGSVTVTAPAACSWTSTQDATAPWLSIASSGSAGTADVLFSAAPNPGNTPRSGTLAIAGQPYTVTQAPAPCNYVLDSASTNVAAGGTTSPGSFNFTTGTAGCSTSAVSYVGWVTASTVTASGGMSGTVSFSVPPNPNGSNRTGTIQFGGQTFTVTQLGAACSFGLNAYGVLYSKLGTNGNAGAVLGSQSALGCVPTTGTDQPSIVHLQGLPAGPVNNIFTQQYTVDPFNSLLTVTRRMTISFGGQIYVIKQTSW